MKQHKIGSVEEIDELAKNYAILSLLETGNNELMIYSSYDS